MTHDIRPTVIDLALVRRAIAAKLKLEGMPAQELPRLVDRLAVERGGKR